MSGHDIDLPDTGPVDVDEIEAAYRAARTDQSVIGVHTATALHAVPALLAEVRAARQELERWRCVHPMGREYTLTVDGRPPNGWSVATPSTVSLDRANEAAAEREQGRGPTPWVQATYKTPWQEHKRRPS